MTADGSYLYSMDEDISFAGYQQTILAQITANEAGSAGNGLLAGTQMQLLASAGAVESVYCVVSASGGQEREKDEIYKERIRTHGTAPVTTGTKAQYEAAAKSVSSEILDARALEADACKVCVYILLAHDEGAAAIIENVETALSKVDERPMTDQVSVSQAQSVGYTLNVRYKFEPGGNFTTALAEVVKAYQLWQEAKIGRAFNPDKLVSELYRAGAARVVLDAGSEFNGGPAEWTEIAENQWCKGTITLGVLT